MRFGIELDHNCSPKAIGQRFDVASNMLPEVVRRHFKYQLPRRFHVLLWVFWVVRRK